MDQMLILKVGWFLGNYKVDGGYGGKGKWKEVFRFEAY